MINTEKIFKPHFIFGGKTFEEYCSNIPEFYFRKEVPDDVVSNFEVIEKLLVFSFYEYKFIDEAYTKAIYTFEMAMSIRYNQFSPKAVKAGFDTLIKKLDKLNVFDANIDVLESIKRVRNHCAHPKRHGFAGIAIWNNIEFINRLINELYDDIDIRLERQNLIKNLTDRLQKLNLNNGVVIHINGEPTILYKLELLFINNKHNPKTYLFACTPLFDFEKSQDGSNEVPNTFKSKLINIEFVENALSGISFSASANITFSPINQLKDLKKDFENWFLKYQKIERRYFFESNINYNESEILTSELQLFQRM